MALLESFLGMWWMLLAASAVCLLASTSADVHTYIVHMDSAAMPSAFSGRRSWYVATLAATADASDAIPADEKIVYVYDNAIHGFSARLSSAQLEQLKKSHGVLSCSRDAPVKKDTTHTSDFLELSASAGLWPASNYGDDVIIGVLDTGIWPESASFRDDGMTAVPSRWRGACEQGTAFSSSACNRKLIGARSFNKGLLASDPNLTIAVNSPRDTDGHGTHTSSTAGGNYAEGASFFGYASGVARGMAPRARLAMYKVLWDEGAVTSDIIAGIDQAISDGVDVISMSLGLDDVALYEDPIAVASFAAVQKGIFVSTSAGNEGPFLGFLHNGTPWVLTVGAGTVDREFAAVIGLGDGTLVIGQSLYPGNPATLKQMPMAFLGSCDNTTLLKKTRHKIVVCEADELGDAVQYLRYAKVDAGLFISNDSFAQLYSQFSFPAAIISPQDGPTILNYIQRSSEPKATIKFRQTGIGHQARADGGYLHLARAVGELPKRTEARRVGSGIAHPGVVGAELDGGEGRHAQVVQSIRHHLGNVDGLSPRVRRRRFAQGRTPRVEPGGHQIGSDDHRKPFGQHRGAHQGHGERKQAGESTGNGRGAYRPQPGAGARPRLRRRHRGLRQPPVRHELHQQAAEDDHRNRYRRLFEPDVGSQLPVLHRLLRPKRDISERSLGPPVP
ncbi:unnamed protein product [Musa acuminata subsp. burmannicoides]